MPVVDKNQLKVWFKNLAKPVQEQFWNWMDSFYHKSEPIPKSGVDNLVEDLAKKADLVGGVVPASQLPFSVNTSEVISIGAISATEDTVTLAVHSSGTNAVRINGVVLTRNFPNNFNYTPVTTGSKFLILYAVNDSGIFRLAEGVEDLEAVEPEIPVGALFVRRILINSAGADIELPSLTGFKEKIEDNWKIFSFSQTDVPMFLPFSDGRASFLLLSENSLAGNFILGGFARNNTSENWWPGKELTILNNTGSNVNLQHIAGFNETTQATFRANYILKNNETVKVKVLQDGDLVEVMAASVDISGKLDKGTYVGTAQDLYDRFEGKIEAGYNYIPRVGNGASGKVLVSSVIGEIYGKIGIGLSGEASEKLEVNGNIKATQIKDQYGTLKSQRTITITGNTTLSENYNGAVLNVTNTCNITVPTGLDANFNCVIFAKGAIIVTFVSSGVTIYAPSGLLLNQDKMASLICTATNNFNLTGELATS